MTLYGLRQLDRPAASPVTTGALLLLALLTVGPLVVEPRPVAFLSPYPAAWMTWTAEAAVLGLMAVALGVRAWLDGRDERPWLVLLFAALAGLMTAAHWFIVDMHHADWQRDLYEGVLNHRYDPPHRYRPLPYGFARLLERLTGDWTFSCVAYRWFFNFWFVWASYRLARLFHRPGRALLTLVPLVLLYPIANLYYWGQLTDPLSHTLFVLSFIYVLEDRPWPLAAVLVLGVLAKETALVVVPGYLACHARRGFSAWRTTAGLGAACVAAYVAARVTAGWSPGLGGINGAGLMIGTNLGFGEPIANLIIPLWENYLHPIGFVVVFFPVLAWRWRRIDPCLRTLCVVVAPLVLLSNVCFGWLYESRNYMPLIPLLMTAALPAGAPGRQVSPPTEAHKPEAPETKNGSEKSI
jgi:hypothetical protein